jgi:hypothetical protein
MVFLQNHHCGCVPVFQLSGMHKGAADITSEHVQTLFKVSGFSSFKFNALILLLKA